MPWRGAVLILGALVFFGATIRGLGLVPALFGTAFLSALASRRNPPVAALLIAGGADRCLRADLPLRPRRRGAALRPLGAGLSMDLLANLGLGFETALTPVNLLYCFVGVLLGTLVGVLPGIGPTATIAMLLPITFSFAPVTALIMLAGIYYGAQYGGSTTAILINLPGESSSAVTAIDGYQMARQGPGRPGARHRRARLVLRRHRRHLHPRARRPAARPRRAELRRARVLLADRARPRSPRSRWRTARS